jgi:predicted double-glycine peptidase
MRVPFFQQVRDGYCLPACAQMALAYHGIVVKQDAIVAVDLLFLPYSMEDFDHAVLVTDANADEVSLLDPATETGAFAVRTDAFLAAWTERDCALAVIRAKR